MTHLLNDRADLSVTERPNSTPGAQTAIESPEPPRKRDATSIGFAAGLGAALFYTAANIFLRRVVHCDPLWVSSIKALPTVVVAAPFLLWLCWKKKPLVPTSRSLVTLIGVSALAQAFGNGLFQWALSVLGLALAIPMTLGGVLIGSAVIGRRFLGEPVTKASLVSIAVLVIAICVLSTGAADASQTLHQQMDKAGAPSRLLTGVAILAFCIAGFVFSSLGAAVRSVSKAGMPLPMILFTSGVMGVVFLGTVALRRDPNLLTATSANDWRDMLAAGTFNAAAFWSLTIALRRIRLLYVNALNVTQTAMAGIAGVVLFGEPASLQLAFGVLLTMVGVLLMDRHS